MKKEISPESFAMRQKIVVMMNKYEEGEKLRKAQAAIDALLPKMKDWPRRMYPIII